MAKLWAGRTDGQTDRLADDFNSSIGFDCRMYRQDITGSMAHAAMLGRQGIIEEHEAEKIINGLKTILSEIEGDGVEFSLDNEDIHMNIEAMLTQRIGDAGKRLHTARSRNDQVAVDTRLYVKEEIPVLIGKVLDLERVLVKKAKAHLDTVMPGYTHLQRAQPTTFAHYMMAYANMFKRDVTRLEDCLERLDECPLGAGALATSTYPVDRFATAQALGFKKPTDNSMDSVSDRDYVIELLSALSILMMHLSRFSEEIILWCSWEFKFVDLDDAYSTGSSIMPQKKNPDVAEIMRGKVGRVYGDLTAMLTILKGLPLTYNRDLQEDKEPFLDADHSLSTSLELMAGMMKALRFDEVRMARALTAGFLNATELADYLVTKGIPFREAHHITGSAVALAEGKNLSLEALPLDALQGLCDRIGPDVFDVLEYRAAVARRNAPGGTGPLSVARQLEKMKAWLHETK